MSGGGEHGRAEHVGVHCDWLEQVLEGLQVQACGEPDHYGEAEGWADAVAGRGSHRPAVKVRLIPSYNSGPWHLADPLFAQLLRRDTVYCRLPDIWIDCS